MQPTFDWRPFLLILGPLGGWFFWQWIGLELDWPTKRERIEWLIGGNAGLGLFILFVVLKG